MFGWEDNQTGVKRQSNWEQIYNGRKKTPPKDNLISAQRQSNWGKSNLIRGYGELLLAIANIFPL